MLVREEKQKEKYQLKVISEIQGHKKPFSNRFSQAATQDQILPRLKAMKNNVKPPCSTRWR